MAKTSVTRRKTRQSKTVTGEALEEDSVNSEGQNQTSSDQVVRTEEEQGTEQDSQMDTVIEVKGITSTVTVSWDKKSEEAEADDTEKGTSGSDQMIDSAGAVGSTEEAPSESAETNKDTQEMQESGDSQMDVVAADGEGTPTDTVTCKTINDKEEGSDIKKETSGGEKMIAKETSVKGKRKAQSAVQTPSSKKTKLINVGFCLFVSNLNKSKTFEEVKDSLANYFMTQSLLVQDIRLDPSKKHAYVDVASEMDLTKALTLNGEMINDKPMKISKARIKSEDKVKVKAPLEDKKAKDAKCLFLKNVPYNATEQDIMKIFRKAVTVRFPGGAKSPNKGIAFVEFKNKRIVQKIRQKKRVLKIQGRVLIVDGVGETNVPKVVKTKEDNSSKANAAAPPNSTLFVSNLSYKAKEKDLSQVFQNAVSISIPQSKGKSRGFAFVKYETVADAEKGLQSSKNIKICKKEITVQYWKAKPEKAKALSKTLIVMGLTEKTSAETLKSAFEGALSARVTADKTGTSKRFGFVDFENEEICKAVKEAMEDCEIDGNKVTVAYAKSMGKKGPSDGKKGPSDGKKGPSGGKKGPSDGKKGPSGGKKGLTGQPAGRGAGKGGRSSRKGRGRGAGNAVKEVENKG